jgi:hypothetical protein
MMIPAVVEKLGYIVGSVVLYLKGGSPRPRLTTAVPDCVLCVLFVIALVKTPSFTAQESRSR